MSIKYNNKVIAGKYKEQVIPLADTINAGIAKIATQEQINEGVDNTSIVTPVYLTQKQDKLTAGEGISIDATNIISSEVLPDKVTIIENDNKTLSTVARKTVNDNIIYDWEGTEAEYQQALQNNEIDPNWYCYITDDEKAVSYVDVLHRNLDNLSPEGQSKFDEKANTDLSNLTEQGIKVIKDNSGSGLEVCDIGMALYIDETKGLRRYLNGQIVDINTNTQAFLNRLKAITTLYPSLLCTEEEWQTAKTMSAFGQVGKFVFNYSSDEVVSVRIPAIVNVQGLFDLQNLGMTVEAGLPNITSPDRSFFGTQIGSKNLDKDAFYHTERNANTGYTPMSQTGVNLSTLSFDASRSNPIYGNSNTVQQEAIQYPYFIQIATGSETENNIINDIELNNPYVFGKSEYSKTPKDNLSWLASKGQWNPKGSYPSYYDWILENVNKGTENFKGTTGYGFTNSEGTVTFWLSTPTPKVGQTMYGHDSSMPYGVITSLVENGFTALNTIDNVEFTGYRNPNIDIPNSNLAWINDYDFVINTADETFRLPLLDGSEDLLGTYSRISELPKQVSTLWTGNNGRLLVMMDGATSTDTWLYMNNQTQGQEVDNSGIAGWGRCTLPVRRGDKVYVDYNLSPSKKFFKFCPYIGNGSLYYYVGETVQNANLIDAGRIGEQLVNKVDLDAQNLSTTGKSFISGLGMPSDKYIDLTLGASGTAYTAPANGWFSCNCQCTQDNPSNTMYFVLYNHSNETGDMRWFTNTTNIEYKGIIPCRKGDILSIGYSAKSVFVDTWERGLRFYYAEGEI